MSPAQPSHELEKQALAAFAAALELDAGDREPWLAARCSREPALLARVRALLAADAQGTEFTRLEMPGGAPHPRPVEAPVLPPAAVGPYRLAELIGAGGMGSVYRAQRDDGLFEQSVAIKFVRRMPGLLQLDALVDAERRLLARMAHPAIARILDGGTTANGLHYLIMEFVEGVALDQYVVAEAPSLRSRVALMIEVCEAVAHAHRNLVLHCDLKPANVLVTAQGRPKLIDFGVARLRDVVDTNRPEGFTRAYTSPQRLAGEPAQVADDVYSLGVMLRELLPAIGRGVDELRAVAGRATADARDARYASVTELGAELQRWLEHRPLQAVGAHWTYRARKLLERRPLRVAAGAIASLGLVAALLVTTALYRRAEAQRLTAETRFGEVRELAKYMIFDLYDQLERVPGATGIRLSLARTGERYLERLGGRDDAPFDVRLESGTGLARLAGVLGVPQQPNLGERGAALAALKRALQRLEALHAAAPARADVTTELARALLLRARISIWGENDLARARSGSARAAALLAGARGAPDERRLEVELLLQQVQTEQFDWAGDAAQVVALTRATLAALDAWPATMTQDERLPIARATALVKLGDGLYYSGDRAAALGQYRDADVLLRAADARWPNRPAILGRRLLASWAIATTLANLGRTAESLPVFVEGMAVDARLREFEQRDAALLRQGEVLQAAYAEALSELGRHGEAIPMLQGTVQRRLVRAAAGPVDPGLARDVAFLYKTLAATYQRAGRKAEACSAWAQSLQRFDALQQGGQLNPWDADESLRQAQAGLAGCHDMQHKVAPAKR